MCLTTRLSLSANQQEDFHQQMISQWEMISDVIAYEVFEVQRGSAGCWQLVLVAPLW